MSKAKIPYLCHSRESGNDILHFFRAMQQSLWSLRNDDSGNHATTPRATNINNTMQYSFLTNLTKLPFIKEIWLFGSRARGDNTQRSDIDIAIICPTASEGDWHKILNIIDNADTLLKIDCIRFDTLNDDDKLKQNIIQFKKILYKK